MNKLTNCKITFNTLDDDKDFDTLLTISVRDHNNTLAAYTSNTYGCFHDEHPNGPYALEIRNPSTKESLQNGTINLNVNPVGNDTWRFNFTLNLIFSDGSSLSASANNIELNEDNTNITLGIDGIIIQ